MTNDEQRNELSADQASFDALADMEKKLQLALLSRLAFIHVSNAGLAWYTTGAIELYYRHTIHYIVPPIQNPGANTRIVSSIKDWIKRHGGLSREDQATLEDIDEGTDEGWPSLRKRGSQAVDFLLRAVFNPPIVHPVQAAGAAGSA